MFSTKFVTTSKDNTIQLIITNEGSVIGLESIGKNRVTKNIDGNCNEIDDIELLMQTVQDL